MLDGRSCVVPRLFSSTCQAENDWSYMKCLLELDIKNGKRPMEIDDVEDEPQQPRKCTRKLDSYNRVEMARISLQRQSIEANDSVVSQMDQEAIEPLNVCEVVVGEDGALTDRLFGEQEQEGDGDLMDVGDRQSDEQQQAKPGDLSDFGARLSEYRLEDDENLMNSSEQQSEQQQQQLGGDSSDSGSLLPRMNRDSSIACLSRCSRSDYGSLASLTRSFRNIIRSGELYQCLSTLSPSLVRCSNSKPKLSCSLSSQAFKCKREYTTVMIVPTGIGAAIGGYAGDALPVARALSSVVDCLISHPNVLNAAMLYWPMPNALYVEGYALDRFAEGLWALQPVHQNRVGLVLDAGIEEELRVRQLQVADAARASLGLPVVEYTVTDTPLKVEKWEDPETGQSTGRIKHPDSLLRAVNTLVKRSKVNAIAIVGRFPDDEIDDVDDYRHGMGIDLLAGVEAVISHQVVKEFQIPCAHAPAMSPLPMSLSLSPKSAAEEIGYTFLPCVLAGLSNAPQYLVMDSKSFDKGCILANDVDSVILPKDACGGDACLAFARNKSKKPLIITVEENETVLNDTANKLGLEVLHVSNYWEAVGVIAAHKAGIDPFSLRRDKILNIGCTSFMPVNGHTIPR